MAKSPILSKIQILGYIAVSLFGIVIVLQLLLAARYLAN